MHVRVRMPTNLPKQLVCPLEDCMHRSSLFISLPAALFLCPPLLPLPLAIHCLSRAFVCVRRESQTEAGRNARDRSAVERESNRSAEETTQRAPSMASSICSTVTTSLSARVPRLSSSPNHAVVMNLMGQYSGLKCYQVSKKTIGLQAASRKAAPSSFRPVRVSCQIIDEVQDIIATQLSVDRASVQPQTKFSELGADSLDTVEIVMALEEKFGVSIGEQDAENISNVQQVADLIEKQSVAS